MAASCSLARIYFFIARFTSIFLIVSCITSSLLACVASSDVDFGEHLLCRSCGHEVVRASDLVNVPSPHALHQRNESIMGVEDVLIQIFQNPQGMQFEVLTASAGVVQYAAEKFPADTWFENYTWSMATCDRCRTHLGWCYEPGQKLMAQCEKCDAVNKAITDKRRFFGFILSKVIHQQYADSLVISPKFYGE